MADSPSFPWSSSTLPFRGMSSLRWAASECLPAQYRRPHVDRQPEPQEREGEIQRAEQIVAEELAKFGCWWHDLGIRPLVGALMSRAEEIRLAELNKTLRRLPPLSDHERRTSGGPHQIHRDPDTHRAAPYLKQNGSNGHTEFLKELFNLQARKTSMEDKNCSRDPGGSRLADSNRIGGEQAEVAAA